MVLEDSDVEMIEAEIEVSVSRRLQCRVDFTGFVGFGGGARVGPFECGR